MTREELLALADRCEKADASKQPELLVEVWDAINGIVPMDWKNPAHKAFFRFWNMLQAEAYIDAALMLVPEGWSRSIGDLWGYDPPLWRCHLRDHRPQSLTPEGHSHIWKEGNTVTSAALAITAASLRARAEEV